MRSKNLTHKNVGFKRWWQKSSPNWGAKIEIHKNKGNEYVKPLDMLNIKITYRNIKCDTYVILEFWDLVPTLFYYILIYIMWKKWVNIVHIIRKLDFLCPWNENLKFHSYDAHGNN
jgi:hypothetical protein